MGDSDLFFGDSKTNVSKFIGLAIYLGELFSTSSFSSIFWVKKGETLLDFTLGESLSYFNGIFILFF